MSVLVTIPQGAVRGTTVGAVSVFKGIPYAAAPVGEHRFAPPRPPVQHTGVLDATTYGATAAAPLQRSASIAALLPDPIIGGPNSLNLNIWTPDVTGRLPVFVWIHGGGFVTGTGATTVFDGTAFARSGIVAVTINYRLAVEGFLLIDGAVPNRGLLDQIAALQWLQDNVAQFGGDPSRVTVGGQSAGAMSVATLLTMPRTQTLFHRAIIQSGTAHHVHTVAEAAIVSTQLCADLGVRHDAGGVGSVPVPRLHAALNGVIDTLSAGRSETSALRRLVIQPVVDGEIVPTDPMAAIRAGAGATVDLLIGTNTDEYDLFTIPTGVADAIDESTLVAALTRIGVDPSAVIGGYRQLHPDMRPAELFVAIMSDWFCGIPTLRILQARTAQSAPTYAYEFGWCPGTFAGRLGACHTLEIPFVFDTLADSWGARLRGSAPPQALANDMHRAWVGFIADGRPGWAPYGAGRAVRRFDDHGGVVTDPLAARGPVWDGYL